MVLENKEERDNLQRILKVFHKQVLCGGRMLCNGKERWEGGEGEHPRKCVCNWSHIFSPPQFDYDPVTALLSWW